MCILAGSRRLVLLSLLSGCTAAGAREDAAQRSCQRSPRAWVLAPDPGLTGEWLEHAGFVAAALPTGRPPHGISGVIVIGSDASDMPEYTAYMRAYAEDLDAFVAGGGILLQLAQAAEVEPSPPFLAVHHAARRGLSAIDGDRLRAAQHPLLADIAGAEAVGIVGLDVADGAAFVEHEGLEVLLADEAGSAVLLAGRRGRGEVVLSALALDRPPGEDDGRDVVASVFFENLARRVTCLSASCDCVR